MQMIPSAQRSRSTLGQAAEDGAIALLANKRRRTILAVDSDFKKHRVEHGVIFIKSRTDDHCLFAIFRAFWQSGHRNKCKRRRTALTLEGIKIQNGETIEHKWETKPCQNHRT